MLRRLLSEAHLRPIFFLLWCLGWAVVATLSLVPLAAHGLPGGDKVAHASAYAVMAAGAVTFCRGPGRLALLALFAAAVGAVVEVAQGYVGRQVDDLDALANGVGAALGYLIALAALVVLRRPPLQDSPSAG